VADDLAFAHSLADAADAITTARFRARDLRVDTKPDLTPVSEADRAAEEAIRAAVRASRRGEGVFGEEFGDDGGDARWIVDPIDGTTNYVRGVPVWATLLALERDGEVVAGLVSAPALGRRWWAERGGGAWAADAGRGGVVRAGGAGGPSGGGVAAALAGGGAEAGGTRCRVSRVARIEDAAVSTTWARRMPPGWAEIMARAWSNRGLGDFWQHCLVAEGALDVGCDAVVMEWDYAAVRLIVEEAGGRCTTFDGAPPHPGASLVTTNGLLHEAVVALLRGQTRV